MKKGTYIIYLIVLLLSWSLQGKAQRWLPRKGFWVLESTITNPQKTTVYFYNNNKTLVYKEQVEGITLNLKKKKVLRRLNHVLKQSIDNWAIQPAVTENQLVLAAFGKK